MDLVSALSSQLGIDPTQAQAIAGTVLSTVRSQVADQAGDSAASAMDSAVPELSVWQHQADQVMASQDTGGGGGFLGSALSAASGGLGGQLLSAVAGEEAKQAAQVGALISKLGIDADKATLAGPLVLSFLKSRMPKEWLDMALQAAPMLTGLDSQASGGGAAGAALGALGNLFGRD